MGIAEAGMIETLVLTAVVIANCPKPVFHHHHKTPVAAQSCAPIERPPPAPAPAPEPDAITVVHYYEPCPAAPPVAPGPLYTGGSGWSEGGGGWPEGGAIPLALGGGFGYPVGGGGFSRPPRTTEPTVYPAPGVAPAPEVGIGQMASAVTLLFGGLAVLLQRKGRRP
jgi:hypothetical protein